MPVNSLHPDYEAMLPAWIRARHVMAGEDAIKCAGELYLPRLDGQSEVEYAAYKARAAFFNATARTAEGYIGLIFRRVPFIKLPEAKSALGSKLKQFASDVDMLGSSLTDYAKNIVSEVIAVGRAGTLIDWDDANENRAYVTPYRADDILNWRVERVNGRNVPTLIVLREATSAAATGKDEFDVAPVEQLRVLKLVDVKGARQCLVELWRRDTPGERKNEKAKWKLVETRVPLRLGKPLSLLPFAFHGPRHARPDVDKLPLGDVIAVNLDHYRLNADYKHGVHFTALPTAWVSGFQKGSTLRIGSSTAWVTEQTGATAGFLEFTGQGLMTFERAMDRDERLMALLGSRLLENNKKVGETAEAIELRQTGEHSILGTLALSVSESLSQVLRWAYWWNSTEETPDHISSEQVVFELNSDFTTKGLAPQEIQALVAAWQAGAISRDSMIEVFRRGELLPDGRTAEEEKALIEKNAPALLAEKPRQQFS